VDKKTTTVLCSLQLSSSEGLTICKIKQNTYECLCLQLVEATLGLDDVIINSHGWNRAPISDVSLATETNGMDR
jgi:hypothetical protein